MSKHFNAQSLLSVFPEAMAKNKTQLAIAQATAEELEALFNDNNLIMLYVRIDELDESLLDILAYDFKVDWYDYTYPLEVKRQTFKDSFKIHRQLGTKFAVETALSAVYPDVKVQEWFEYGGNPHMFRVIIEVTNSRLTTEQQMEVLTRIRFYKNLRSKLEGLNVKLNTVSSDIYAGAKVVGIKRTLPKVGAAEIPRESEVLSGVAIGVKVAGIKRTLPKVDAMQYNTYEDISKYSNDEIKDKTYLELLYKQEEK